VIQLHDFPAASGALMKRPPKMRSVPKASNKREPVPTLRELFGANLRDARERRGMMQKDLAAAVGLSQGYVSQIELGARNTNLDLAADLAAAVGLSITDLITPQKPPRSRPG
jgi:DNA-binding XRE family transcriptional regulator